MRVEAIDTFQVAPRWLFVRIATDAGLIGWGEASLEGNSDVVRAAVVAMSEYLTGQVPARIEDHWQTLMKGAFYRGGPVLSSAVAGIDQALWDIAGRTVGLPVSRLLGGPVRDRVRVYGWVRGDDPGSVADAIAAQCEAGLTAVKMNVCGAIDTVPDLATTAAIVERATVARSALGDGRDFALDFHGRVSRRPRGDWYRFSSRCTRSSSRNPCCPTATRQRWPGWSADRPRRLPRAEGSARGGTSYPC